MIRKQSVWIGMTASFGILLNAGGHVKTLIPVDEL